MRKRLPCKGFLYLFLVEAELCIINGRTESRHWILDLDLGYIFWNSLGPESWQADTSPHANTNMRSLRGGGAGGAGPPEHCNDGYCKCMSGLSFIFTVHATFDSPFCLPHYREVSGSCEHAPRRPIPKKKIVLKIVLKIILRSNFDSVTCANY